MKDIKQKQKSKRTQEQKSKGAKAQKSRHWVGVQRCAQNPVRADEKSPASSNKSCKRHWSVKRRHAAPRSNVAPPEGKARSLPNPRRSQPNQSAMRDRARHKVARVTLNLSPPPSRLAAPRRRREATLVLALVFRGSPSFDGPPSKLRRVPRAIAAQRAVDPHAAALPPSTRTETSLWWKDPVPLVDAHRSRCGCKALFCTSSPMSKTACHTSFWGSSSSFWVSASSRSKLFIDGSGMTVCTALATRHATASCKPASTWCT